VSLANRIAVRAANSAPAEPSVANKILFRESFIYPRFRAFASQADIRAITP
jgi:hypothetical protein